MSNSILIARAFFLILSVVVMTAWATASSNTQILTPTQLAIGALMGGIFAAGLIGLDLLFRRFKLKTLNLISLGLFFGYLLGMVLLLITTNVLSLVELNLSVAGAQLIKSSTLLFGLYFGVVITLRSAEELSISLPFIRFKEKAAKKRDIVIDASILQDTRVIDLAGSGILDHHLVVPRFVVKELYAAAEGPEEADRNRARRALETLKKLETIPSLDLRYNDTDFNDVTEPMAKLIKLARMVDANLLTADINQIQISTVEGVRIINIHSLSNALKPLTQTGESISIKIQRYGKEPRQGVGYLSDGTMVVVNGGGDYIGDTVKAQVLSVKHTSSGRMVFCNFMELMEKTSSSSISSSYQPTGHAPHIGAQQHQTVGQGRERDTGRV